MPQDYVTVDIDEVVHQTDKAVLIRRDDEETWIPLSCVDPEDNEWEDGGTGTINVVDWFAEKEGLI